MEDICNTCYELLNNDIIVLKCGHKYHYDCILNSYKYSLDVLKRLCPYCRSYGGYLPLKEGTTAEKHIHYGYKKKKITNNIFFEECGAIIKSGKNKGNKCTAMGKYNGWCGRHVGSYGKS